MANHVESFWGEAILDAGWTVIPNLLSRKAIELGITPAEFLLISNILSHKHDTRDPFPSQELLAAYQGVNTRQIRRLVQSLKQKGFLKTGRRRNKVTGNWISSVYSFEPLLKKLHAMAAELFRIDEEEDIEIVWDTDNSPQVVEGPMAIGHAEAVPQVVEGPMVKNTNEPINNKASRVKLPQVVQRPTNNKIENKELNITTTNKEIDSVVVEQIYNQFKKIGIITTKGAVKNLLTLATGNVEWVERLIRYAADNGLKFGWVKTRVENKEDVEDTKPADKYDVWYKIAGIR